MPQDMNRIAYHTMNRMKQTADYLASAYQARCLSPYRLSDIRDDCIDMLEELSIGMAQVIEASNDDTDYGLAKPERARHGVADMLGAIDYILYRDSVSTRSPRDL